jgi:hypothetical protein
MSYSARWGRSIGCHRILATLTRLFQSAGARHPAAQVEQDLAQLLVLVHCAVVCQLRFDRAIDAAMDVVLAYQVDNPVGFYVEDVRLHPGQAQRDAIPSHELVDVAQLRGPLGVNEVGTLEIEYDRAARGVDLGLCAHRHNISVLG